MLKLLTAFIFLFPSVAFAQSWYSVPGGSGRAVEFLTPTSQRVAYYDFSDTTDSSILSVGSCSSITVIFDDDTTAATRGAEVYVRDCVSNSASTNTCEPIYSDAGAVTLNGDPAAGRRRLYNYVASWIYVDVNANAGSDAARVQVICN